MTARTSWMRMLGGVAGVLCLVQASAVSLTCVDLNVGNNSEATLLAAVKGVDGFGDAENVFKNGTSWLTVNGLGTKSGTWSYEGNGVEVIGFILKGGPGAVFCYNDDLSAFAAGVLHDWDADHLPKVGNGPPNGLNGLLARLNGNGNGNGGNTPDLSYFAVVTRSVPEPSSILAGLFALAMGLFGWNRMRHMS
jgi:hypothetical protein